MKICLLIGIILSLSSPSWAHVGLTFPQARQYDLDFLDNVRTRPPCGMPKGNFRFIPYLEKLMFVCLFVPPLLLLQDRLGSNYFFTT